MTNSLTLPSGATPVLAVIGLGYVGLPMAVEFARHYRVVGFDINASRVAELRGGHDSTLEVEDAALQEVAAITGAAGLTITDEAARLAECNVYLVTVPTPVDRNNRPDLTPLIRASETVGKYLSNGDVIIYESTVYPGCTEEDCLPVVEKASGMTFNKEFFAGYSPERINPGDKEHTFTTIRKVTSGSTPAVAEFVDRLYNTVVKAGTFPAASIRVAEMAKVIENSQRDINIAFVNEIARICAQFGIDTGDVLEAAGTKWNFLKFKPGLVGGHCIGVDPYYLAQKAQEAGYHPEIILAGRRMNDTMGPWITRRIVKLMIRKNIAVNGSRVLVLGITFKENCPDIRNSKVIDLIREFEEFGCRVDTYDPWASAAEVKHEYGVNLLPELNTGAYDAVVLAVAHDEFSTLDLAAICNRDSVIFDVKGILDRDVVDGRV